MKFHNILKRKDLLDSIGKSLELFPVVALLGPRQSGKTTLAREIASEHIPPEVWASHFLDLEDPNVVSRLDEPKLTLEPLRGLVVIDEIQRRPDLFPFLRVLADRPSRPASFLILGSASRELIQQSSESLAGRIKYIDVMPFDLREVGLDAMSPLWLRGGYPPAFLADSESQSDDWRAQYVRTFLEQDMRMMGLDASSVIMRRLWMMLCHFHGQILNMAEIAQSLDISATTTKRYIDILEQTFMIRRLHPWFENVGKRQVKSPKVYFRDTGLLHALLGLRTERQILAYPRFGFSWEGFVIEQIIRRLDADRDAYFYKTHGGTELDLLILRGGRRYGFEIKYADAPKSTKSIAIAKRDLGLKHVWVVYPGKESYPLGRDVDCVGLQNLDGILSRLLRP